jgi:hypothetical protein
METEEEDLRAGRTYGPKECGACRWWKPLFPDSGDGRGPLGPCRMKARVGDFPGTAPICDQFLSTAEGAPLPRALKGAEPERRRRVPSAAAPVVHAAPVSLPEDLTAMTREEFADAIREALREDLPVPLAPKWEGGSITLKPGKADAQPKEIPLDALFHKVVMVRDRLRVLEQKLNAHPKLSDTEKVEMQQYVTRCYGSLTTFNVLFRDERDRFIGEKGDKE